MARQVVGLDIGTHSIKAVLLKETLRGIDLAGFYERPVGEDGGTPISDQIRALFRENGIRPDAVITSIPGNRIAVHHLSLPFSDPHKLEQVLPFEIEPLIPFASDEVVVDHFSMGRTNGASPSGSTAICTGVLRKDDLQGHLGILRGASIDPKIIELDNLALYYAFTHYVKEVPGPVALLDVGAAKTGLCIVADGKPKVLRTFLRGGEAITQAIAGALNIPPSEAEKKKLAWREPSAEAGVENPEETTVSDPLLAFEEEENARIATAVREALAPWFSGIFQTLKSFQNTTGTPVTALYLSGGGARLSGLAEYLGREMAVEVRSWTVSLPSGEGKTDLALPGIGLALRGVRKEKITGFNFRKGEFFARKEVLEVRGKLLTFGGIVLAAAILGGVDLYLHLQAGEARYTEVKKKIRTAYLETFPGARNVVDESRQMQTAVEDLRKKVAALGGSVTDEISPLDLILAITEKLPPDLSVEVQDLVIDRGRVRIQGVTASFDAADRIKKEMETIPRFQKVEISDAKLSADQKQVNFRISAEYQ